MRAYVPAVEVTRGPIVESVHCAALAVCDADGAIVARLGSIEHPIYLRSSAKPFQTMALIESGAVERFGLTQEEIAVTAGSHNSEPEHLRAVTSILAKLGLDASALQCGTHTPFSREVADAYRREGRPFTPLENNCSGKHAGMLAAALAQGQDVRSYIDPSHVVQQRILAMVAGMTGRARERIEVAVDGCGAPTFAVSLAEAARAFARLIAPASGAGDGGHAGSAARVVAAMRAHPLMVGGRGTLDSDLTGYAPRTFVAKRGAEGVQCIAFETPDGRRLGLAVKISDGDNGRARVAVACEALRQVGALDDVEAAQRAETESLVVRNNAAREVGRVQATFDLAV